MKNRVFQHPARSTATAKHCTPRFLMRLAVRLRSFSLLAAWPQPDGSGHVRQAPTSAILPSWMRTISIIVSEDFSEPALWIPETTSLLAALLPSTSMFDQRPAPRLSWLHQLTFGGATELDLTRAQDLRLKECQPVRPNTVVALGRQKPHSVFHLVENNVESSGRK